MCLPAVTHECHERASPAAGDLREALVSYQLHVYGQLVAFMWRFRP
jgi:hypothetical protein